MLMNIIHLLLGIILEAKGIKEHHWKPFIKQLFEKKVLMRCEFSTVDILLYGLGIMKCLFPCLISFFFHARVCNNVCKILLQQILKGNEENLTGILDQGNFESNG